MSVDFNQGTGVLTIKSPLKIEDKRRVIDIIYQHKKEIRNVEINFQETPKKSDQTQESYDNGAKITMDRISFIIGILNDAGIKLKCTIALKAKWEMMIPVIQARA